MNQDLANANSVNPNQTHQSSDLKRIRKLLHVLVVNWYYFLISLVFSVAVAFLINAYTIPTYLVNSSLLIEEVSNSNAVPEADRLLMGFGLQPGAENLQNQMQILSSWTLIKSTLKTLPFEIDVYKKGILKQVPYYPDSPVKVVLDPESEIPYNLEFTIKLVSQDEFRIRVEKDPFFSLDTTVSFLQQIQFDGCSMTLIPTQHLLKQSGADKRIRFVIRRNDVLAEIYQKRLDVRMAAREGSILTLSLEGTNRAKDIDFLNRHLEIFMATNLAKKNFEAERVVEFINSQLAGVSDLLSIAENRMEEFRSKHQIMDISAQGQLIIQQAVTLEDEKANLMLSANYFDYLTRYLSKDNLQEVPIAPSSMGINDPLLASLMQELADLQAEYFSGGVGDKNPLQTLLEMRIYNTKQSIRETLLGIIQANNMAIAENIQQIENLNKKASSLPKTERQLLGIEREFELNNTLYTFLLQRKAEAQIRKASNTPDNEVVDAARGSLKPVAPRADMAYLLALLLGLGLPLIFFMIAEALNQRVTSDEDLNFISNLPIVGHLPHNRLNYQTVVLNDPQSPIAESFRSLRVRMEFFTRLTTNPVIMVSSCAPEEGKSFTALNLASAYHLAGNKTILLGFDLRRPKIALDFNLDTSKGISTYLIGKDTLSDIIQETMHENFHVITSGPVPPNPAELIDSKATEDLFEYLRRHYDYIVVDTAPIGTVIDNYALSRFSDANILVVRHKRTFKRMLEATIDDMTAHGLGSISLLVNDIQSTSGSYHYKHAYRYNYKYKATNNGTTPLL